MAIGRAREELKRRLLALEDMLHGASGQNYNTPPVAGARRGGGGGTAGGASENGDADGELPISHIADQRP